MFDGFEKPFVYTYSLESTIAEKLDAILKRMAATSRMKDFYDIYYLSHLFEFDGRKLEEAIQQTLEHRGTPHEKDSFDKIMAFREDAAMQTLWKNYEPGAALEKPEFEIVLNQICRFLQPIYKSILNETVFSEIWSTSVNGWVEKWA